MMNATLSDETLLTALQAWNLPQPLLVRRLSSGFTSEVWKVETGKECFICDPWRCKPRWKCKAPGGVPTTTRTLPVSFVTRDRTKDLQWVWVTPPVVLSF